MMDFVLSKVAMAVCALMVISVLSGTLSSDMFVDKDSELKRIARNFCMLAERVLWSDAEVNMIWKVPFLTVGEEVNMTISDCIVWARAEGKLAASMPSCQLHTWTWDGQELNSTRIKELDSHAPETNACSGQYLELSSEYVLFDSETMLMVFVSSDD